MTKRLKLTAGSSFLLFMILSGPAAAQPDEDTVSRIARGNEAYHEKNYLAAAEIYESLVADGLENGYLYYNLGNTYMRLGETGRGILNYLRAKRLIPREENLEANLRYAVHQTVDQIEPPPGGGVSGILFWMDALNLVEHLRLLIVVNAFFWLVLIGWLFFRNPAWDMIRKAAMGVLLLAMVSAGAKYYFSTKPAPGVVLADKVDIKSDKGDLNVTLFQLHEGAIVSVGEQDGGWVRVTLGTDKSGWTPVETIGF